MGVNWNNIRPLNNSLNDGFEELVCQLASKEQISETLQFQRIGKPDAGKECYWLLKNGKLHMWQAKYFTTSLTLSQWAQIEESVKKAIDSHSDIEKYYVCIPLDLADPKIKGKKSALDRWKDYSKKWQQYAAAKGYSVEFVFWGNFELVTKLAKRENEGLRFFWFNNEELTDEWFYDKNSSSINALGARYSGELNVELPISKIFSGISRDDAFANQIHKLYNDFFKKFRSFDVKIEEEGIDELKRKLIELVAKIKHLYESIKFVGNDPIPIKALSENLEECVGVCNNISSALYRLRDKKKSNSGEYRLEYSGEVGEVTSLGASAYDLAATLKSPLVCVANRPYLIIAGNAGMGKSHLLADIVERRKLKQKQSLLLLGEDFTTEETPWTQILGNILRKNGLDEYSFLGALNAKAESEQSRIVIFIDAINEGNGRKIWPNRLKSFINSIDRYPWVGLVLSVRSSFEKLIAPKESIPSDLIVRISHNGFAGVEYGAVKRFFQYYNIIQPTSPLLNPEFHNPLFLKLFCQSLFLRRLRQIPEGYEGITKIIFYFLESINLKLARPENLHYDDKLPLVKKAVQIIISKMVESGSDYVTYVEAEEMINEVFRNSSYNREPYLKRLISEGVFNEDLYWESGGSCIDVIYMAYQRFQDHLSVSMLLDNYLNISYPEESFKSGKLHDILKDSDAAIHEQNLVEALSIQIPERLGKELFELVPHAKKYRSVAEGFIQSLIWRRSDTIKTISNDYIKDVVLGDEELYTQFLEVVILSSMKPRFYFNAESLHRFLMRLSIAERDRVWTTWLQDKYDDKPENISSIVRVIDWAWSLESLDHVQDESIYLGCVTLSWFLTSSNRYLRDAATKALVCLFQKRVFLILKLLQKFEKVNDPYVIERIYAASYGAVLRTENVQCLVEISEYIYSSIFNQDKVYPHVLLRDYARNIIEFALFKKCVLKINVSNIRPPYKSERLVEVFPTNTEIDKKYRPNGKMGNLGEEEWGATAILKSMATEYGRGVARYGDFGRYTFQNAFSKWNIDYDGLSNYAIQRIFELGYVSKVFTEFDTQQGTGGGNGHKERIGKKYQWIIFYELLARVSDQFDLVDESDSSRPKRKIPFEGPWYPYVRDIDPTTLIKESFVESYKESVDLKWITKTNYQDWNGLNEDWIIRRNDIPLPEKFLEVVDDEGRKWLWLECLPNWKEPELLGEDYYSSKKKRLWLEVNSFLIKEKDLTKFKKYLKKDANEIGYPQSRTQYRIFDREYYWSPAFLFFNKPYYGGEDWGDLYEINNRKFVIDAYRTTDFFNWEEEYDCSKLESIQFYKPTLNIWQGLRMDFSNQDGCFLHKDSKEIIAFNPYVYSESPSGLLICKSALEKWLSDEGLLLVWKFFGEKQFISFKDREWKGPSRLNVSGLLLFQNNKISGELKFEEEEY